MLLEQPSQGGSVVECHSVSCILEGLRAQRAQLFQNAFETAVASAAETKLGSRFLEEDV